MTHGQYTICNCNIAIKIVSNYVSDDNIPQDKSRIFRTPILRKRWYEVGVISIRVINPMLNSSNPSEIMNNSTIIPDEDMCLKLNAEKSIVDSGTTNIRLPDDLYRQVNMYYVFFLLKTKLNVFIKQQFLSSVVIFKTKPSGRLSTLRFFSKVHCPVPQCIFTRTCPVKLTVSTFSNFLNVSLQK